MNPKKIYDAIVVGSGAAGGMAAKELTEGGLSVLLLEAGPRLEPTRDFTSHVWPYEMPYRGFDKPGRRRTSYWNQWIANEYSSNLYVKDTEHPYVTTHGKPFQWVRSRFVGGKLLHWGRHAKRLSDMDLKAADHDGYGDNWPITYAELAPYYDRVESFVGVNGTTENIPHLPDGKFLPPMGLTCAEKIVQKLAPKVGMRVIPARTAQRTRRINDLGVCHYCGECDRGCDVGGMWNSVSDTLPAAARTGRLTLRPNSVVREILVDPNGKARGILFVDRLTHRHHEARGRVIVLGASALESTRIMLNSVSRFWPHGIGNSSGVLGRYLMDDIGGPEVSGFLPILMGREPVNEDGKQASVEIVPYRNITSRHPKFIRSYTHEGWSGASMFPGFARSMGGFGSEFKQQVRRYYTAPIGFNLRGEMLARWENHVEIDREVVDAWGIPVLKIHCEFSDNEREMGKDAAENLLELFHALGAEIQNVSTSLMPPGSIIHEMGTCRMGDDPKKSVLNKFNQSHDVPNIFVVDGSSFVTSGGYAPTLTIGALAARASDYIVEQLKRRAL
ncbi:MAG: GMC family oxidoreductase [Pyrinomonadaceae bacterium]|nr:GMC family oxidoreductase [Pyrinomonadaceae bacterium]